MKEDKRKYLPKFYDLETLTQEDLNKLALERNTLVKENERLNSIINQFEEEIEVELTFENNDGLLEHNTFITIHETLEKVLKRIKELKEGK
jgi:hypothetical protein